MNLEALIVCEIEILPIYLLLHDIEYALTWEFLQYWLESAYYETADDGDPPRSRGSVPNAIARNNVGAKHEKQSSRHRFEFGRTGV